ncbi:hypothetical protein L7F22_001079 [Adiantum nelumboides]|nr:hypothetical protein [Adiantum nelumboides]
MLCKLENADSGELLVAVSVVGAELQSNHIAKDKVAMAAVQTALSQKIELLNNNVGHSVAQTCSRRQGKAPEDSNEKLVHTAPSNTGANHASNIAEIPTALILSSTNYLPPEKVDKGINVVQATVSSPSDITQRSLSGSLLFCPSDVQSESVVCDKDVVSSSATPIASSSGKKVNAGAARPRKSIVPEGKKARRNTLNPFLQSRRSTVFSNSSISRSISHTPSLKKTRSSASENSNLPQIEKASHSKTWKRNLFQFAFHKHKQKRLSQL